MDQIPQARMGQFITEGVTIDKGAHRAELICECGNPLIVTVGNTNICPCGRTYQLTGDDRLVMYPNKPPIKVIDMRIM